MKDFLKSFYFPFTVEGIKQHEIKSLQRNCKHEHWNCDKQIRTIECKKCGLRAWIDDYVDLYHNVNEKPTKDFFDYDNIKSMRIATQKFLSYITYFCIIVILIHYLIKL